jgi:peptide/nickel transport system ATP-binding protein
LISKLFQVIDNKPSISAFVTFAYLNSKDKMAVPFSPLLCVENLRVQFHQGKQTFEAVKGISYDVFAGQTLGIVGESGSGKSVSSLALMRLLPEKNALISSSKIRLDGQSLELLSEREMRAIRGSKMAMIFQEPMTSLNPVFRCGNQIVEAIQAHNKVSKDDAHSRVIDLFHKVQLPRPEDIFLSYPHQLSGGQKQRVMIAMALSCDPSLLVADEPTTALDVTVQKEILALLKNLQESNGMGMIFITHDLGVIADIADSVAVMRQGEIVEYGSVNEILDHPDHPYTRGLLACRPSASDRLRRLPVVQDFLSNRWPAGQEQMLTELSSDPVVRKANQDKMYAQEPLLRVEKLKTWFPVKHGLFSRVRSYVKALDEVTFDVYPGETLGLVGESGCGKTTLGRSLLRLVEPSDGKILFVGDDVRAFSSEELRKYRKTAQIIFQDPYSSLNPGMTAGHAILEPLQVHNILKNNAQRRDKVYELLEQVGLEQDHFNRYPHEFSGGQRQRICIARALALQPRLLVCDESVSALDVSVQAQVLNLLNDLKESFGFTSIFISHDLSVVRYMSDRIMVMKDGKIEELAEADEIYENPQSVYTQKLIQAIPGQRPGKNH